jgi:hypothetical protein
MMKLSTQVKLHKRCERMVLSSVTLMPDAILVILVAKSRSHFSAEHMFIVHHDLEQFLLTESCTMCSIFSESLVLSRLLARLFRISHFS